MILSAAAGACTVLLPGLLFCTFTVQAKERALEQVAAYEDSHEELTGTWVYTLARDIAAGEEITEADLKAKEMFTAGNAFAVITNKNEILGLRAKCNLSKGWIVQEDGLYQGARITDDLRYVTVSYADLPKDLTVGDFVDLRIFFPDGEDFVVLSHKKAEGVSYSEEGEPLAITLRASEEEILLLASAYVDSYSFPEVKVYALCYVSETQRDAVVNYPLNQEVFNLLETDPNVKSALIGKSVMAQREMLETNLIGEDRGEIAVGEADYSREELLELFE